MSIFVCGSVISGYSWLGLQLWEGAQRGISSPCSLLSPMGGTERSDLAWEAERPLGSGVCTSVSQEMTWRCSVKHKI